MWQSGNKGDCTRRLIGNIEPWHNRKHGEVDYYLTMFLNGHGAFNAYLTAYREKIQTRVIIAAMDQIPPSMLFWKAYIGPRKGIEFKLKWMRIWMTQILLVRCYLARKPGTS